MWPNRPLLELLLSYVMEVVAWVVEAFEAEVQDRFAVTGEAPKSK